MKIKEYIKKVFSLEILRYGVAGGCVTLSNALLYFLFLQVGIVYTVANIISLIFYEQVLGIQVKMRFFERSFFGVAPFYWSAGAYRPD